MNSSFSLSNPYLQLYWDSVSLGAIKHCPRYYQYAIIEGWRSIGMNVDLQFGIEIHAGLYIYRKLRHQQHDHESALRATIRNALRRTWADGRPQQWFDSKKNRISIIRTLVWYLDEFQSDPLEVVITEDGKPAIELGFLFPSGIKFDNEEVYLCGVMDRRVRLNSRVYPADVKTTGFRLDDQYFAGFRPDNQMNLYKYADEVNYENGADGIIIDAIQVGASYSRVRRELISFQGWDRNEWLQDTLNWLTHAVEYAHEQRWPMNDRNCYRCPFRPVCSRPAGAREQWLRSNYVKRIWDPKKLVEEGHQQ